MTKKTTKSPAAKSPAKQQPKPAKKSPAQAQPAKSAEHAQPLGLAKPEPTPAKPTREETIAALQAQYAEVVGRPTKATAINYLRWKISLARKGRIRTGALPTALGLEYKILPFRLDVDSVAALDAVVASLGYTSRMRFLRDAVESFIRVSGESDSHEAGVLLAAFERMNSGASEEA